jgi:hypothetical protein
MIFNLILNFLLTGLVFVLLWWLLIKKDIHYKNYIAFPYLDKEKNSYYNYRTLYGIVLFIAYIKFIELGYVLAYHYIIIYES